MSIPVYLFTGFLESGKTSFINETVQDRDFINGEKTLLIVCEEGVEEYDEVALAALNIDVVTVEDEEDLTEEFLIRCETFYNPVRILIEYNGMWKIGTLLAQAMPKSWDLVQIISTVDATTFEMYSNNMKALIMDQVGQSDLVVFNRCDEDTKKAAFKRSIKALNRRATVAFEDKFGNPIEDVEEDLPYDLNESHIELEEEDFGIFYIDALENPKKYMGKTIKFKGVVYRNKDFANNQFVPGRFAMTCCADDITFIGYMCEYKNASELPLRAWVEVEAEIRVEYRKEYKQKGPVLYAKSVKATEKAKEDLIYFN